MNRGGGHANNERKDPCTAYGTFPREDTAVPERGEGSGF